MRRLGRLDAHIPYIRYLLSVDPGDPAITSMDPLVRRRQAFEALRALTLRGASLRPVVLVFEDQQGGGEQRRGRVHPPTPAPSR
jgi:hypothetical protein